MSTDGSSPRDFLASSPRGLADLLARELEACGAQDTRERSTGVAFSGTLETAYRICLASRVANRVFLVLAELDAPDAEAFYRGVREIDWSSHLGPGSTLACDFSGRHPAITHSHFGALKLKDAIVDTLRERTGSRPDINAASPDVRVHAHAHGSHITVSLDLSGESLHRRGYRAGGGEAPLKENVAAGVLLRAGWPEMAEAGAPLLDPMCGSGTFVIEAALIAARHAPGLFRKSFGFLGWRGHHTALWERVLAETRAASRLANPPSPVMLRGSDQDARMIALARANATAAGCAGWVELQVSPLSAATAGEVARPGLVVTNPPYGVRLDDRERARMIHRQLGAVLKERFQGWSCAVLTGEPELGKELGIRAHRTHALWNGAIECRLLRMQVTPEAEREPGRLARPGQEPADSPGARMFANRLGKNLKRLSGWARRTGVSCYRIYDADMPEYAFALDVYRTLQPEEEWLYVQEYAAPADIEIEAVRRRRREAFSTLSTVTGIPRERIRVRMRRRTRGGEQYEKVAGGGHFLVVGEAGLKFSVNLDDYLDTGLFLDHRITRARLRDAAKEKRFLNLFAYTGAATVYAAAGGARSTTSVDMSRTYLVWARENLALNGFTGPEHALVQADCLKWLEEPARQAERYELIFLDPPTFSNSKRMEGVLDVERDHPQLIDACARLLTADGLLVFSTNSQRFKLDEALKERYAVRDLSGATLPQDFERNPRIHRVFELRLPREGERGGAGEGSGAGASS